MNHRFDLKVAETFGFGLESSSANVLVTGSL
jgi:hypothetical protein